MPYLIYAIDHDGMHETREKLRGNHREHLASAGTKLLAAGALLDDDGMTVIGGLSILDTVDREEAQRFADADPYSRAGIRRETRVIRWRRRWLDGDFIADQAT